MPIEQGFKCWLDALYEGKNTSTFGIVKADHDAPLMDGWMAHTNYQLINTVGLTREEVSARIQSQFDYENLPKNAHTVIYNDSGLGELEKKVTVLLDDIQAKI